MAGAPSDGIQKELQAGRYDEAIAAAREAIRTAPADEDLSLLLVRGLLDIGRYPDADQAAAQAIGRIPDSIRLRWIAREAAIADGHPDIAARRANEIRQFVESRPYSLYHNPGNLVAFARAALLLGADPKQVMDQVLAPAQAENPARRDVYLARGELALEKDDFPLAAKAYQEGLKQAPDDPDFHAGLARAYQSGDRKAMLAELDAALKANPRHVPSLLLLAENAIDSEDYAAADQLLGRALAVNPWAPDAWAYRAVIAQLQNQPATAAEDRRNALHFWAENPRVDWLIGKKLAQKYRFTEAAASQRQALQHDLAYQPAEMELANDLLRSGEEQEGWQLAEEVHARDDYDLEAYNLSTLHDTMAKYATLDNGDFVLRMTAPEAKVYGPRVLALLERARGVLTAKYGVELVRPTYVEIFGDQKDFAVRTFGVPDIGGFLGVCFGRVVTANGPAANSAHPANWETVLWHEFCHVVTLTKTKNKMPRWLSEGISVYEESQADPSWGMRMDPRWRELIVGGQLTPIAQLSAAFLAPPDPDRLQFAYFESSLVVQFIIERYGLDALKAILTDLGAGTEINRALAAHTVPLPQLEGAFAGYARARAEALAPGLRWDRPRPELMEPGAEARLAAWAQAHPDNYWALRERARQLLAARRWAEVKALLTRFLEVYPSQTGPDCAYPQLAEAERALGDAAGERAVLARWADQDDNATDAYLRLGGLDEKKSDWQGERADAERFLAVNPLVAPPYRALARAAEAQGDGPAAIAADRTMLLLSPADPAEVHFDLAQQLHRAGDPEARRQVLEALEDAPRYRAALSLLLEIDRSDTPALLP